MRRGKFSTLSTPSASVIPEIATENLPRDAAHWLRCWRRPEKTLVNFVGKPKRISMRRKKAQYGGGRLKALLFTVILVIGIFVAFKTVPAFVAEYELSDKMQEQARFAVVNRYSEDQIKDIIFKEIQDLDIPATRDQIQVSATQEVVKISVDYTVPVDLLIYSTQIHFTPSSEDKSIM
jgi:hypothetical protein